MLPQAAVDLLQFDIADADALAATGDIEEGLGLLRAGLERAKGARMEGHAWAEQLIRHYQVAMRHFTERYPAKPPAEG
jgi:hypothetical protein